MGREVGSGKWEVGERECVWGGEKKGEKSSLEGSEVKEEMGIVGSERQISRVKKKKKKIKSKTKTHSDWVVGPKHQITVSYPELVDIQINYRRECPLFCSVISFLSLSLLYRVLLYGKVCRSDAFSCLASGVRRHVFWISCLDFVA